MSITLIPIDPADIPASRLRSENAVWQVAIRRLMDEGLDCLAVTSPDHTIKQTVTGLRGARRGMHLEDEVKIVRRREQVYVIRADVELHQPESLKIVPIDPKDIPPSQSH